MNYLNEEEKLIVRSFLSIIGGAIVGTLEATYQYLTTPGGHVTFAQAVTFAVGGFLSLLYIAVSAYIPKNAQALLNDATIRANELENALNISTAYKAANNTPVSTNVPVPVSTPITIHVNGTASNPVEVSTPAPTVTTGAPEAGAIGDSMTIAETPDIGPDTARIAAIKL